MSRIGRTFLLVVAFVCAGLSLWWGFGNQRPPDSATLVEAAVEAELLQDVSLQREFYREIFPWALDCGTIRGPGGAALDPVSEVVDALLSESADYCALVNIGSAPEIVELDIGSTDMPAFDWMTEHDLPDGLLVTE